MHSRSLRLLTGFSLTLLTGAAVAAGCGGSDTDVATASGASTGGGGASTTTSTSNGGGGSSSMSTTTTASGGGGTTSAGGAGCGNDAVEGTEECDDGNQTNGDGCENDCTFTCISGDPNRDHCDDGNPCNGTETCGTDHACSSTAPLADGTSCGSNGEVCIGGNCATPSCGDGFTEAPEECDDGNATNGDGCDTSCKFSCVSSDPTRNCASTNACVNDGTCDDSGTHTCTAGAPKSDGTACGNGEVCHSGVCVVSSCTGQAKCTPCTTGLCDGTGACVASTCGDGCVDANAGETCDPPNGGSCSATCMGTSAICGNGVLEAGEQCDDGNLFNLDGCDSTCKYEVVTRMTTVSIQGTAAPAFCTPTTNRLGTQSITNLALGQLNTPLQNGIDAGTTNILTQFLGLDDLTGVADANGLSIGIIAGSLNPAKGTWPGNAPIDWWFLAQPSNVDAMGQPTGLLTNGALAGRNLTGGPSNIGLSLILAGSPALLQLHDAKISGTINGTPAPNTPAPPPAQLAAGLSVFQTITASGSGQGLCGAITVDSLAQIPVPSALTTGSTACSASCGGASKAYTYCGDGMPVGAGCNSLLDVLVGGCKVIAPVCLAAINPEQPDVAANGGNVTMLTLGAGNKVSTSVTNGDGDGYSAYLKFDANRAHITGETCTTTGDCITGKTCQGGTCQ